MKALMILENGFEDTEALSTYDVLKRGGFELITASFDKCDIETQCGHKIKSNIPTRKKSSPISLNIKSSGTGSRQCW